MKPKMVQQPEIVKQRVSSTENHRRNSPVTKQMPQCLIRRMRKSDRPVFRPANKFTISETGPHRVLLRSANVTAELSVLAENLFRLRIVRGKRFSSQPSW